MTQKKTMVSVFRHGYSPYNQDVVELSDANDLTEKGIAAVTASARALRDRRGAFERVVLLSSPRGRTLHSAKLIGGVIGVGKGIIIEPLLDEVANFNWDHFSPLVSGGKLDFGGRTYTINAKLTNPKKLALGEYYNCNAIADITPSARSKLPPSYVDYIDSIEIFESTSARLLKVLEKVRWLAQLPGNYRLVLSTHDALTGYLSEIFTGGEERGLTPGGCIDLELTGEKLVVTRVGDIIHGRSDIDVFAAFNERFAK